MKRTLAIALVLIVVFGVMVVPAQTDGMTVDCEKARLSGWTNIVQNAACLQSLWMWDNDVNWPY